MSGVHSENVADAHHLPDYPETRQPVEVSVYLVNNTDVESVRMIYCRVQNYACGPAENLTLDPDAPSGELRYYGTIPWEGRFFRGVRNIGYKFDIEYTNGTNESSPLVNWPTAPTGLPPGADKYYFYTIIASEESPAPPLWLLIVPIALAAAWRNRR